MRFTAKRPYLFFLLPALILVFGISIFPMVYSIYMSFMNVTLVSGKAAEFVGLFNYFKIFKDPVFASSVRLSLIYSGITVTSEIVLGIGLGLLINSLTTGKRLLRTIVSIPMLTTPVIVGITFKVMLLPEIGIVDYVLGGLFGIPSIPWLGDPVLALLTVAAVDIWQWTAFVALIVLASVQGIPSDIYEAALLDGSSGLRTLFRITLPLIKPALVIAALLRLMDTLKVFDHIYVMTKGGPVGGTDFISVFMYRIGFKYFHISYASALSWVYLMIFSAVILAFFKIGRVKV